MHDLLWLEKDKFKKTGCIEGCKPLTNVILRKKDEMKYCFRWCNAERNPKLVFKDYNEPLTYCQDHCYTKNNEK